MKRRRRELRDEGRVIALAFNDPSKLDQEFADTQSPRPAPKRADAPDVELERERWW